MKCEWCGREVTLNGIRNSVCWECIEAESIIATGFDMYDNGPGKSISPAKTAKEKVLFLIEKGIIRGK